MAATTLNWYHTDFNFQASSRPKPQHVCIKLNWLHKSRLSVFGCAPLRIMSQYLHVTRGTRWQWPKQKLPQPKIGRAVDEVRL